MSVVEALELAGTILLVLARMIVVLAVPIGIISATIQLLFWAGSRRSGRDERGAAPARLASLMFAVTSIGLSAIVGLGVALAADLNDPMLYLVCALAFGLMAWLMARVVAMRPQGDPDDAGGPEPEHTQK